jgi:hypothetical protein
MFEYFDNKFVRKTYDDVKFALQFLVTNMGKGGRGD